MTHILKAVEVVIPILFILIFGIFSGKKEIFGNNHQAISVLSKLVLTVTLPAALFAGTISISLPELKNALLLFVVLLISIISIYLIGFFIARIFFKRNVIEASIAGLSGGFSAGPFYGPALLGNIYGAKSTIAVSMIALVINLALIPLATILIEIDLEKKEEHQKIYLPKLILNSIFNAIVKVPYVWSPLLAIILLLLGFKAPDFVINSLVLIGKATSGVAIFVAGMTIAVNQFRFTGERVFFALLKDIGLPLLFILIAPLVMLKHDTTMFNEGLLLAALPSGPMIVLLATKYDQYKEEAASILAISTMSMIVTVSILIILLRLN